MAIDGVVSTPDVVIVVRGGFVSAVHAADPSILVVVVDYDLLQEAEALPTLVEPFEDMEEETQRLVQAL